MEPTKTRRPTRIGQYEILQTLGTGSFGKVKLAVHALTGHKVAMKILNKKKIVNMDISSRVKREIQYLKLLRHPHIIKLYEVISTPTEIIMVMEYAGNELFNYIVERGRMPEEEARRFFQQIICAVEYCHRHSIVHRDLKPENLLLDDFMMVKIADFGLSNIMTDGDFLKTSCGSPNYAAPEVISGKLYAGPEIDIWSCGVILYVMLCGRLPFDDEFIPNLFKKINGGVYHLPSYLSIETKHLLSSMLVVDPVKRITIPEIRELPWFKVGLPSYLEPLPPTPLSDPVETQKVNEEVEGKDAEVSPDLGAIDPNIVNELAEKMGPFEINQIIEELKSKNENQFKVAYQLVRDHKRMVQTASLGKDQAMDNFLSSSPPAWNAGLEHMTGSRRSTSIKRKGRNAEGLQPTNTNNNDDYDEYDEFDELDDFDLEERFAVLDSSLPQNNESEDMVNTDTNQSSSVSQLSSTENHETNSLKEESKSLESTPKKPDPTKILHSRNNPSISVEPMSSIPSEDKQRQSRESHQQASIQAQMQTTPRSSSKTREQSSKDKSVPSTGTKKIKASKWHFGIRSRSPPMEVMLEIYRTLKALGMEWKKKDLPVDPPNSTAHQDELSKSQDLFFVETRSRIKNVIIRMDLQLYRVDESNYLVDFRLVDYFPIPPTSEEYINFDELNTSRESSGQSSPNVRSGNSSQKGESSECSSNGITQNANVDRIIDPKGQQSGDVCSPFLFLDCACKLIVELAGAGG